MKEFEGINITFFNSFFIGMGLHFKGWKSEFVAAQLKLWNDGVRDGRIHDDTFIIARICEAADKHV